MLCVGILSPRVRESHGETHDYHNDAITHRIDHGTWTRDSVPIKASLDWVGPIAFGMLDCKCFPPSV
jgi:hypothetical protein